MVAQRISPSDFENLDNVTGINIQQGVTAYVYVDGKHVAQLNGGAYDFINQNDINNLLGEKASIGLVGHVKKVFNSLVKAITGKKVSEVIDENSRDYSMLKTYDDVLRTLQPKSNIEVYLKSDSPFSVIFGSKTDSYGNVSFSPMQR